MSLAKSMNTRKVRRVMTKMEDGLSKASLCSRPGFDLEYMFTVNSQVEDPGTKPPYPDGDYGNCSAYTGYEKAISHTAIAIMKRPGHLWGPVPGQPTQVEEFYPITEEGFSLVPKVKPGEYELKAGPFIFELDGPAYSVMSGMDMKRFAHSTYRKGRMSIVGVKASEIYDDPRLEMTEKSLDGAFGTSVASCPSANGTLPSEK